MVIVFEGLDRTGKSTQRDLLLNSPWLDPKPAAAHMPTGLVPLTSEIYQLTETEKFTSPLARQLLHLTCHAENMPALVAARENRGLVLDRWWWSTMAYGLSGGQEALGIDAETFTGLVGAVWAAIPADVVFLFTSPYEDDVLNKVEVVQGYEQLASANPGITVRVPRGSVEETAAFIAAEIVNRGLVSLA